MSTAPGLLTLDDLITCSGGDTRSAEPLPSRQISSIVIDSRRAQPGSLFIALKGEHKDGHDFVLDAVERGARIIICERPPATGGETVRVGPELEVCRTGDVFYLIVSDALGALQEAAAHWRRRHRVRVIGVTGSVGKTTTKEAIDAVLRQRFRTLRSEGNYNNEIGLPLTLLHLSAAHERAILEMGMYALGEIAHLASIALPQVGVVTNVGPTHLERLGSIHRIAEAKAELPQALPPEDEGGVAILNIDDKEVCQMSNQTRARVFTYGLDPAATVWADGINSEGLDGVTFVMHFGQQAMHTRVPTLGRHSVHTALAAAAVGLVEGMSLPEIASGLRDQPDQLRLVAVSGPAGSIILDDTYNASPASCLAALNLLNELDGRRIAILGDMYELGDYETQGHQMVGQRARDVADILITVGPLARTIATAAREAGLSAGSVYVVEENLQASTLAQELLEEGDVVLVKGSRGLQMEEIVATLARPVKKGGLKQR